jgi:hypothetical protein
MIKSVEAIIHLPATLSAFLSPSLDQGARPNMISPVFDIEGVDDNAIAEPAMSPKPPSRRRTRTRVVLDADPKTADNMIESAKVVTDAPITGVFT